MLKTLPALVAATLITAAPASADVLVRVLGTVSGGTAPPDGPLVGAAIGDPVELVFEVDFPVTVGGGQGATWMDNPTFELRVGGAVEVHRYPAAGLAWWLDGAAGLDGVHVRGEALATLNHRIEMRLEDSTQALFSSLDPIELAGTYGASEFDGVVWRMSGWFNPLQFDLTSITVTPVPLGAAYCTPAVANSTGTPAAIQAFGGERANARRLRLEAQGLPLNSFGYFLASETVAIVPMAGGSQGTLCLGGSVGRFSANVLSSGQGGTFSLDVDTDQVPQPMGTQAIVSGSTWHFQAWYRDANPNVTSNFTDGLGITFL